MWVGHAKQISKQYWTGSGLGVPRFDNTYKSAWAVVDIILEKDPVDAILFHQELDNLQKRLSPKAQAGIAGGFFKFLFRDRHAVSPLRILFYSHSSLCSSREKMRYDDEF